ncbi:PIG-L family deacetylase [Calidifontibacter terrae]
MDTVLFIHAHPDDESLWSGVMIAELALLGHEVIVMTCTLGEEGEVIPAANQRFELTPEQPRRADTGAELATLRAAELGAAVTTLGARSVLLSQVAGRPLRDSGMVGSAAAAHANAFAAADVEALAVAVAHLIDTEGVTDVVSYESNGGYGHPDHIQAHRLACASVRAAQSHPSLSGIVVPLRWAEEDRQWLRAHVAPAEGTVVPELDDSYPPSVLDLENVRILDDPTAAQRQVEALRYHRTQVEVRDGWYTLSNNVAARLSGREAMVRLDPRDGSIRQKE